ncbi:pilus assembly FimT family protein [Massilia aerilata]|uniref:Tfp pilus assembly protein FimT/FimU n=1 Tax=Massilia aerilata TaxID=453817 RepID=A0ABW0RRY7_9BURK
MRSRGFTTVELIVVMILIGILSAIAIPRLIGNGERGAQVFGDQLVSGLRLASTTARAHRRTVCATLAPRALALRIATVAGPFAPCTATLGSAPESDFATTDPDVVADGLSGALYFQPNGEITSDRAGATQVGRASITVRAQGLKQRSIQLEGATGYVE